MKLFELWTIRMMNERQNNNDNNNIGSKNIAFHHIVMIYS